MDPLDEEAHFFHLHGMIEETLESERARIRREEVEPLREALRRIMAIPNGPDRPSAQAQIDLAAQIAYEALSVFLRAADERGK